jgi:hypothetical protein
MVYNVLLLIFNPLGVLKNLYNAHENEVLCADISQQSGLLVTGSKEAEIKIW